MHEKLFTAAQQGNLRFVLLLACALFVLFCTISIPSNSFEAITVPSTSSEGSSPLPRQADAAYRTAAQASIAQFKHSWLKRMIPKMKLSGLMPNYGLVDSDWDLFKPILSCPTGRPLRLYGGTKDGSKYLCDVLRLGDSNAGCVIYSFGSKGDFSFEQDMLEHTPCEVHTFDCTYNGTSIGPRHTYYKWCIAGSQTVKLRGAPFRTWSNITTSLRHASIDILKMDIDGYEYEVISELTPENTVLPDEIGIEVHVMVKPKPDARPWFKDWIKGLPMDIPHTVPALGLLFLHLANLGYGVYHMDIITGASECCSEFSLLRIPGQ